MLDLATHIVATKAGHFEQKYFEDHYEHALQELIRKKRHGEKIERPKERASAKVINLMDALRHSVDAARRSKLRAPASRRTATDHRRGSRKRASPRARRAG
jgi:DNA end-binding protein Ku